MRKLPLIPTLMVLVMVPVMIGLGLWQVHRANWKADMLTDLEATRDAPPIRITGHVPDGANFRRAFATLRCLPSTPVSTRAGQSSAGQIGYSYFIVCDSGRDVDVIELNAGWSPRPGATLDLPISGEVTGRLFKNDRGRAAYVLVADKAIPPLEPSASPTIGTIPNNHMGYAVQWFAFAATLLVIYGLFVFRRSK